MSITITPHDVHDDSTGKWYATGEVIEGERLSITDAGVRVDGRLVLVRTDPLLRDFHRFEDKDGEGRYTHLTIEVR